MRHSAASALSALRGLLASSEAMALASRGSFDGLTLADLALRGRTHFGYHPLPTPLDMRQRTSHDMGRTLCMAAERLGFMQTSAAGSCTGSRAFHPQGTLTLKHSRSLAA